MITRYEYDANENLQLIAYGQSNVADPQLQQPANTVNAVYDERDRLFQVIPAAGHPAQSTEQYDYDRNGNRSRIASGLEDTPRITTHEFDGYDRPVIVTQSGAHASDLQGTVTTHGYDAEHNLTSVSIDGAGGPQVQLAYTAAQFDSWNRLQLIDRTFLSPVSSTDGHAKWTLEYTAFSEIQRLRDDNGHGPLFEYDAADRLTKITDAADNTVYVQKKE